jgi:A/G-specific adenine glycosylase
LAEWYVDHGRSLPWRGSADPWAILVSEVMLQQTSVTRVEPVFTAFMRRFPTPAALAESTPAELIDLWGGLGYQRRALNLRKTSSIIAANGWPTDVAGLRTLPGVGPYTAAAVACFAFGVPEPAFDTNLRRVLSRWIGREATPTDAAELIDIDDPPGWNQAVMDLGAMACTARRPDCGECPVAEWCLNPGFYLAPPRQSRYEGSVRQARAAVLRGLARNRRIARGRIATTLDLDPGRVEQALIALIGEGSVVERHGELKLAD